MTYPGFGLTTVKVEGGGVVYDTGIPKGRKAIGTVGTDYMELPIPKNMSRARVHKMVDEWLDRRAKGPKGMGA